MAVAVGFSEGWYLLAAHQVPGFRTGYPSDPFQPVEIPLYLGLICAIYLLGVLLARADGPGGGRRRRSQAAPPRPAAKTGTVMSALVCWK